MQRMLKVGSASLSKVNITGGMVKSARNIFASGFKFKPWGAVKLGKVLTKAAGWIGVAITVLSIVYELYKEGQQESNLTDLKTKLKKKLADMQADIYAQFNDNESYYKNFAPSFLEMQQHAEEMQEAVDRISEQTARLHDYGERLRKHFDIKDVVKDMAI